MSVLRESPRLLGAPVKSLSGLSSPSKSPLIEHLIINFHVNQTRPVPRLTLRTLDRCHACPSGPKPREERPQERLHDAISQFPKTLNATQKPTKDRFFFLARRYNPGPSTQDVGIQPKL